MRLRELAIENFGCIGSPGVTIRIDNIVVLVGANNVGKSTVLKAYREFAGTGTGLPLDDFHDKSSKNEVMIAGVFSDLTAEDTELIGSKWEFDHGEYGPSVKYRWVWTTPEAKGRKQSWNENEKEWEDGGMGGWDSKVASCVPTPLEISPLEDSGTIEKKVIEILASAVKKTVQSDDARLATLVAEFEKLATEVQAEIGESINAITSGVESYLTSVFPDHKVNIRPAAGKFDPEKIIANGSFVEIKDSQGGTQPLIRQGTGLQRTFLWSAIGALADNSKYKDGKKTITRNTPRILMVEEPEVFLHPPAIRSAREALYGVAEVENWQVIVATHSPVFIDVAKPHTTIVRLERDRDIGTKTFATDRADFDEEERDRLRMIRACHPTVNEFFFSRRIILVEGDTEMAVFNRLQEEVPFEDRFQIVNCFGKANIPLFQHILNHFGVSYAVVHDVDSPRVRYGDTFRANAMWSMNRKIRELAGDNPVVAHTPNFEGQYFNELTASDKPYAAIVAMSREDFQATAQWGLLKSLFEGIESGEHECIVCTVEDYKRFASKYRSELPEKDAALWEIESGSA